MPLPFILGGLVLAAAGYGLKKSIDASETADEINEIVKKVENLKEETKKRAESAESDCMNALTRLDEKKLHVKTHVMSRFVSHFNQLKGHELVIKDSDMKDLLKQVSILGAVSADEMEENLEKAKAHYAEFKKNVKKANVMVDQIQAIEKMARLFTRQITKFDALFFSLSSDAIATMKKNNYDFKHYSEKEKDRLCVTVSTLMTLSAFLKVPIMDEHQKLQEKAQRALEIMKGQMNDLESGHYNVAVIQSKQKALEQLKG
ncbi:hypothetical protein Yangon179_09150 [Helicobacter pylori]